nr:alpha/beta fold hydrolase [Kibdelosporangium sp. MJ126-NF4]
MSWLLRAPDEHSAARLFCFPYSGAGASMFSRWPRHIGDMEVCPIQLPARENRRSEPHFGTYHDLASAAAASLEPYLDRPFILFGHCAGALAAYELAVFLAENDMPTPSGLVISAQAAPHDCPYDRLLDLSDDELSAELATVLTAQGGVAHPVLIQLALGVLKQDLDASRAYRRPSPVPVPTALTVLHWADGTEISEDKLREWQHYSESYELTVLPGGHHDLLSAPDALLTALAKAAPGSVPARSGEL